MSSRWSSRAPARSCVSGVRTTTRRSARKSGSTSRSFRSWYGAGRRWPTGGDSRRKETDDQAGQIYVTFPRFPTAFRSRIIGYVWDTVAPVGTVVKSKNSSAVTYVVVRSGQTDLGRWCLETRNVYSDYKQVYGEEPAEDLRVVSVAIDSNDTRSSAELYLGEIFFRRP